MESAQPGARRLLFWLSEAAMAAREEAGAPIELVAAYSNLGGMTIRRFEQKAGHWPKDPDALVAAYAKAAGIADPREIYRRALELWYEHCPSLTTELREERASPPGPLAELPAPAGAGQRGPRGVRTDR